MDTPSVVAGFGQPGRPRPAHRRSRPPSGTRSPSPGGRRSPPRSAAATSPVAPAPVPAASCRRSRRCSSRRWITSPPPRQRLGPLLLVAGFQVSISGRFWVSTGVWVREGDESEPSGEGLPHPFWSRQGPHQRLYGSPDSSIPLYVHPGLCGGAPQARAVRATAGGSGSV